MKLYHKDKNITELVTKIEWSGDISQVARQLNFSVAVSPHDEYLPATTIYMGDMIKLLDDNDKEVFQGYAFSKEKSISSNEMSVNCYDGLIYLLKSNGTYNFKKVTPQAIVKKLSNDFGIQLGSLEGGSPISRIFDAESIYSIIMTAYTIESAKSKKQYIPVMKEGKLEVILKGKHITEFVLDGESNIIDSTYGESIENSINKVKIYDEEGNAKGEVNLSGVPGILQDIYKVEEGIDPKIGAKALLKGKERTASIEALGDLECVTGNAVVIKEPFTGLNGLFYIDNDTHTFQNGQHTMSLGLSYQNLMDSQEGGQDPAEIKANNTSYDSSGGNINAKGKAGALIKAAQSMVGFKYSQKNRFGSNSADCSSLIGRAMKMAGITNNAQVTTKSITSDSRFIKIPKSQARAGDVMWQSGHVALNIGNGKLIEASSTKKVVRYSELGNRFTHAYRIKGI